MVVPSSSIPSSPPLSLGNLLCIGDKFRIFLKPDFNVLIDNCEEVPGSAESLVYMNLLKFQKIRPSPRPAESDFLPRSPGILDTHYN